MPQIGVSNNPSLFLGQGTQPFGAEEKWMRILDRKERRLYNFIFFFRWLQNLRYQLRDVLPRGKRNDTIFGTSFIISMVFGFVNRNTLIFLSLYIHTWKRTSCNKPTADYSSNPVPTTRQQDVFALLVPSLLTICYKVVELNRLVASCSNNLLSSRGRLYSFRV